MTSRVRVNGVSIGDGELAGLRIGLASDPRGRGSRRIHFLNFSRNGVNITDADVPRESSADNKPPPPPPPPNMSDIKETHAASCTSEIGVAMESTAASEPSDALTYCLFFDFECTGTRPWAVAMAVIGFPTDPALFETGISCEERIMIACPVERDDFNASTREFWFDAKMDAARQHIAQRAMHVVDDDYMDSIVYSFVNMVRAKYPGILFATDNPTLDARYLDNIMDDHNPNRDGSQRISLTKDPRQPWRRVQSVDDMREGFLLAAPHLQRIPQRPNCPLRYQARSVPNHAPDGDLLRIAADYGDLLMASLSVAVAASCASNKISKK